MRVKMVIAYDGSHYFGFQKQQSTPQTVTSTLHRALKSLGIEKEPVGSGRTDRGVHASGQVVHLDLPLYWSDLTQLKRTLNQKLHAIAIKQITQVDNSFHARFDALKRRYRYIFKTTTPTVFEQKYIAYYPPFDPLKLQEALHAFVGVHDFEYFSKKGSDPHTTRREIFRATYTSYRGYHLIYFDANSFLRAQVRMMIDASMRYATHQISLDALKAQIAHQAQHTRALAPAQGLYLATIYYPKEL
jgi:tRNA pseudouridine38-40 synthase